MKIGIIGATGHVGQAITKEAINRGDQVTAIVRNADKAKEIFDGKTTIIAKDAMNLTREDLSGLDVLVDAFASTKAYEHVDLATRLVSFFREDQHTRLIFVIGSSVMQHEDGSTLLDETVKQFANEPWIGAVAQQDHEYKFLQLVDNVDWTVVIPSTDFTDGPKTNYKVGGIKIIQSATGKQEVSVANFATAVLDESEQPQHIRSEFSVVDA